MASDLERLDRQRREALARAEAAEARLAEVEAALDECVHPVWQLDGYSKTDCFDHGVDVVKARVRAAARGAAGRG